MEVGGKLQSNIVVVVVIIILPRIYTWGDLLRMYVPVHEETTNQQTSQIKSTNKLNIYIFYYVCNSFSFRSSWAITLEPIWDHLPSLHWIIGL